MLGEAYTRKMDRDDANRGCLEAQRARDQGTPVFVADDTPPTSSSKTESSSGTSLARDVVVGVVTNVIVEVAKAMIGAATGSGGGSS